MANREDEYKRLRSYLNKFIRGEKTDAVLRSVASGPAHLVNNVEAVNDSLYIVSAKSKYLDARLGDYGIVRPVDVGMSDDVFRNIGIEIKNRKQVRDLVNQLLRILYGEIYTRATSYSQEFETYNLQDGDNLIVSFDETDSVEVVFSADQFSNINSATAQEVADAITKSIRKQGFAGSAFSIDNGNGPMVVLISSTDGPSSTVRVFGGSAQNVLKFETIRPTSGGATTQWTLTQEAGGNIRATWSGGQDPSLGKIKIGDYANMYGSSFDAANKGTFVVTNVQGGPVGSSYFEFVNPNGMPETVVQGTEDAVLFFFAKLRTLNSNTSYAAAFQTSPRELEIFMPATTRVVRRGREGAAHLHGQEADTGTTSDSPENLFNDQNTLIFDDTSVVGSDQKAFAFVTNGTGEMESLSLALNKTGTTPTTGKFKIELRADLSSAPDPVVLGETAEIDISSLPLNPDGTLVPYTFTSPIPVLEDATQYWFVINYTEALSVSTSLSIETDSLDSYSGEWLESTDGGSSWATPSGAPVVSETIQQLVGTPGVSPGTTTLFVGQGFTTIAGGLLVDATLGFYASGAGVGTFKYDIYETSGGLPTGSPIASTDTFDMAGIVGGFVDTDYTLPFSTPVSLNPATKYAIVMNSTAITVFSSLTMAGNSSGDIYPGGGRMVSSNSGATWTEQTNPDLRFSVNLGTAAAADYSPYFETNIIPTVIGFTDPSEGLGGPYSYDPTVGYTLGEQAAAITQEIDGVDDSILFVDDSSDFPDGEGKLIIGFGTARQEGPVPYISRPSSQTLRINPAYNFKNQHPAGTDISLISQNAPAKPSIDGTDFPFYVTDSVAGRIYAEQLLKEITATGIRVVIYILYPDDIGLGKEGDVVNSEKYYIWGREEDL
jgi:hypothetical protein